MTPPRGMDLTGIDLATETVRTERLVLRPFRPSDVDAVLRASQDPETQRRLGAIAPWVRRRARSTQEGVVRSCLGYRDGRRADALLFGRLPDR